MYLIKSNRLLLLTLGFLRDWLFLAAAFFLAAGFFALAFLDRPAFFAGDFLAAVSLPWPFSQPAFSWATLFRLRLFGGGFFSPDGLLRLAFFGGRFLHDLFRGLLRLGNLFPRVLCRLLRLFHRFLGNLFAAFLGLAAFLGFAAFLAPAPGFARHGFWACPPVDGSRTAGLAGFSGAVGLASEGGDVLLLVHGLRFGLFRLTGRRRDPSVAKRNGVRTGQLSGGVEHAGRAVATVRTTEPSPARFNPAVAGEIDEHAVFDLLEVGRWRPNRPSPAR